MNDKFTTKAAHVISQTKLIAEKLGHTYIGTEHILLALAQCGDSSAQNLLQKFGLTCDGVQARTEHALPPFILAYFLPYGKIFL